MINDKDLFKETFSRMHASENTLEEVLKMAEQRKRAGRFIRRNTVIAIVAVSMGTVVAAATLNTWSRSMQHQLKGTTEQMQELEEKNIAAFPDVSVTDEGVTVTLEQSIVNGSWGYVALKISGYNLPKGAVPAFEAANLTVKDWDGSIGIGSSFDSGLLTDGYKVIGEDGQEPQTEDDGSLVCHWQDEDGNLEYIFDIYINDETGKSQPSLSGKEVNIHLEGLGYYTDKEVCKTVIPGNWQFSFVLPGADDSVIYSDIDKPIGETGAILKEVEVSPISMAITYSFPRKIQTETGYHEEVMTEEDGTEKYESVPFSYEYYEEPPYATGIRMNDGTLIWGINEGPGSSGYTDGTGDTWVHRFGTGKILDPAQIVSLLFINTDTLPEDGEIDITEDNCFEISIQ